MFLYVCANKTKEKMHLIKNLKQGNKINTYIFTQHE